MRQCEWVVVFVSVLPKAVQTCSLHVLHLSQELGLRQNLPSFLGNHLAVQWLLARQLEHNRRNWITLCPVASVNQRRS